MQELLGGTGTSGEPTMSDTATPTLPVPTGLVATLGLLLLILAHADPACREAERPSA